MLLDITMTTRSRLPGFGLTLGITLTYLGVMVLLPFGVLGLKAATLSWSQIGSTLFSPRTLAAFQLSFWVAGLSALINAFFGTLVAWVQVRYHYFGKSVVDALIDLPFALPTSVAGIALTAACSSTGVIGHLAGFLGFHVAYTPLGIVLALTFIGLPFVIRTVEPVLRDLDAEFEEAAMSLGADAWQRFTRIIFPIIFPAIVTGFGLAWARALSEYGSVVFISGNLPFKTEIVPLLIMGKLDQYDYAGATVLAVAMLTLSFVFLLLVNGFQAFLRRRQGTL